MDYWCVQMLSVLAGKSVRDVLSDWQQTEVLGVDHSTDIIATLNRMAKKKPSQ